MSVPPFTIRVRLDLGRTGFYAVKPRAGELVIQAVTRSLKAASGDPRARIDERHGMPLVGDRWRTAYRLSFTHATRGPQSGDVDVPAFFCTAWL